MKKIKKLKKIRKNKSSVKSKQIEKWLKELLWRKDSWVNTKR